VAVNRLHSRCHLSILPGILANSIGPWVPAGRITIGTGVTAASGVTLSGAGSYAFTVSGNENVTGTLTVAEVTTLTCGLDRILAGENGEEWPVGEPGTATGALAILHPGYLDSVGVLGVTEPFLDGDIAHIEAADVADEFALEVDGQKMAWSDGFQSPHPFTGSGGKVLAVWLLIASFFDSVFYYPF
jgi:hypothetical protein